MELAIMLPRQVLNFLSQTPCVFSKLSTDLRAHETTVHVFRARSFLGLVRVPPTVKFVWFNAACFSAA